MHRSLILTLLTVVGLLFSACAPAQTGAPAAPPAAEQTDAAGEFSLPHPILSDLRIRQAIAHCIDRDALISSIYAYVSDDLKPELRMDSFLPKAHWAYGGPYTDYAYDPDAGMALLEEAGWTLPEGTEPGDGSIRQNADGEALAIKMTTTTAQFRQTWAAVAEQNLLGCGIQMIRLHVPASWFFGATTGLQRRDFEIAGFGWTGQADPAGQTLYACNQIPLPGNGWTGQNYMGWCNEEASDAIVLANNILAREDRIAAYNTVQQHFAEDMVSLPLFQRAEAEAWSKNMEGLVVDPTEYGTASAAQWRLTDGGDTIVIGFSQEPASMFSLVERAQLYNSNWLTWRWARSTPNTIMISNRCFWMACRQWSPARPPMNQWTSSPATPSTARTVSRFRSKQAPRLSSKAKSWNTTAPARCNCRNSRLPTN